MGQALDEFVELRGARLRVRSRDEVGRLATAVNRMAADLQRQHDALQERNADLARSNALLHDGIARQQEAAERIEYLAYHDSLTDLPNRNRFGALLAEAVALKLRRKPIEPFLKDGSAIVTAILLALCLPPLAPWWLVVSGTAFAILLAKHLYGGLGANPFNPAMVGYAVLLVSFPVQLLQWLPPAGMDIEQAKLTIGESITTILTGSLPSRLTWDAITSPTPLDALRTNMAESWPAIRAYNLDRARAPRLRAVQHRLMEAFGFPPIAPGDLARIGVPTTLIWGRHDLATSVSVGEQASARYRWPLYIVEDAGDDPALEQPDGFVAALERAMRDTA